MLLAAGVLVLCYRYTSRHHHHYDCQKQTAHSGTGAACACHILIPSSMGSSIVDLGVSQNLMQPYIAKRQLKLALEDVPKLAQLPLITSQR